MKKLLLLRGLPFTCKESFIFRHNLKEYLLPTIETLQSIFGTIQRQTDGKYKRSSNNKIEIYELLIHIVKERMKKGEFIVIDDSDINGQMLNEIINISKEYDYDSYCINFYEYTNINNVIQKNRELNRRDRYPKKTLEKMYDQMITEILPDSIQRIEDRDFILKFHPGYK